MGKMVNIDDDMDNTFIRDTGNYKSIATGHRINVNPKGKQDFEFTPHNKLLFAGNNIPPASDKSDGFIDVWLLFL
jgi:putative DNA primase/helicase